jgi:hypothetical protein
MHDLLFFSELLHTLRILVFSLPLYRTVTLPTESFFSPPFTFFTVHHKNFTSDYKRSHFNPSIFNFLGIIFINTTVDVIGDKAVGT